VFALVDEESEQMPRNVAIIQARLGSHRLKRKVLLPIGDQAMLDWVVTRTSRARTIDQTVIATTTEPVDDELVDYCRRHRWDYFRGSENDVLSRYVDAARFAKADRVIRITSDCPFVDPNLIDTVVSMMDHVHSLEYTCNFLPRRCFPRGLDVECMKRSALERLNDTVKDPAMREHVTLAIHKQLNDFVTSGVLPNEDYSMYRWTVDTPEDWALANQIAREFDHDHFSWTDILTLIAANPTWQRINAHVVQKSA
jgi:spore coat polysaccharide biosynthesis protein SpsF